MLVQIGLEILREIGRYCLSLADFVGVESTEHGSLVFVHDWKDLNTKSRTNCRHARQP